MTRDRLINLLLLVAVLGIMGRAALAGISTGSYDAILWRQFAAYIADHGLLDGYRQTPFNQPPISGLWAASAMSIARHSGLRFEFIFKLPMIASDAVVCLLLWKIWSKRGAKMLAALVTAGFAWNIDALLISSYHCNIDSVYAMLALLAVYLVEERQAHFLGGLALGAAINIKLIPAVLIIPMIGGYHEWRALRRFIGGLAIGAIPFLPPLLLARGDFIRHVVEYTSVPAYWGLNHFLRELIRIPRFSGWAEPIMVRFHETGRYLLLLTIALLTLVMRRRATTAGVRVDRYTTCAASAAIFLILAPGFGMQHTVFPIPLLMVAAPFVGMLHGTIAGTGAVFIYWLGWTGTIPLESTLGVPDDAAPSVQFGLLAWATLVAFVWKILRGRDDRH